MLLKKILAYFNFVAVIFGAFDFVLDRERKKLLKTSLILAVYSKIVCILFLLTCPLYVYTLIFTRTFNEYPTMITIIWGIEYTSLLLMTGLFYFTATIHKKSIKSLINEGFCISRDTTGKAQKATDEYESKSLTIFLVKFIIDHIVLTVEIIVASQTMTLMELEARILILICFVMNFISYLITNGFVFIMLLVQWKFRDINRNMIADILHEDSLSFAKDVQAHRTLRFFCEKVVKVFSKTCLANFLYAFATTLSAVSELSSLWQ